jgi:hypothetical protein
MSDQDPDPAGPGGPVHRLGPLEFDRANLAYYAACRCGHRFGPLASVASLQAAFERHRASVEPPADATGV